MITVTHASDRTGFRRRRWRVALSLSVGLVLAIFAAGAGERESRAQSNGLWLASRTPQGGAGGAASSAASVAADGRLVAFESVAADLVPGDTNGVSDVFLFDRASGGVSRVGLAGDGSVPAARSLMPALSADGAWLAFRNDGALTASPSPYGGLYLRNLASGETLLIAADDDAGRGQNVFPAISADGGRIAFESRAALDADAAAGSLPRRSAIFVWTRATGRLQRVSPPGLDADARDAALSGLGGTVAFVSAATTLADASGRTATTDQVYVANLATGAILRASRASDGTPGNDASHEPALSGDGSLVAFNSLATNLVAKDVNLVSDIFVWDQWTGQMIAVTDVTPADNVHHPGHSADPSLSADGKRLAFASAMYTLTPNDRNGTWDIYVHDLPARQTRRVSLTAAGAESNDASWAPALSAQGNFVAFTSAAGLGAADAGDQDDVYLQQLDGVPGLPAATHPPHPTATSTPGHPPHPTATPGAHPTATSTPGHPSHPTATATLNPHHPTPTAPHQIPHPTATMTLGNRAIGHASSTLYLPLAFVEIGDDGSRR